LLFRSEPEIHLYRAFKAAGVTFAPLPVFLRGGQNYSRLEPDFVLLKDGVLMVVEVDGDTYHREFPVEAHARLAPLDREGAKIERIRAEECSTPENAKGCAEHLLKILEKRIAQRR
jgi:very-short-patch-repair endonuclease